jgi:phospholipid/cholesterol/gamma-HCH transport system substrate-binding protein
MSRTAGPVIKFGLFAVVMAALMAALFMVFGQFRTGASSDYSAVFSDASSIKPGDSVRVSGIRVGTVAKVALQPDKNVIVSFNTDRDVVLTTGTKAAVRYLNLVGDRYLELIDGPGSTNVLTAGAQIPVDHTAPALDLDLLLGGLKPVIRGLNPQDVNALTASLIQVFQGQGGTLQSILSKTSSFATAVADHGDAVDRLIDNLNTVAATLSKDGQQFSGTIDRLQRLIHGLSADRDPISSAIQALDNGTAAITDLLAHGRPPLKGTIDQLNRIAPVLDHDKDRLGASLERAPENYRKLIRLGAYGSFINYYVCGISIRATDLQGRTVVAPWVQQETGRCAES